MTSGTRIQDTINLPSSTYFNCHQHGNESIFNQLKDYRVEIIDGVRKTVTDSFDADQTKKYVILIMHLIIHKIFIYLN